MDFQQMKPASRFGPEQTSGLVQSSFTSLPGRRADVPVLSKRSISAEGGALKEQSGDFGKLFTVEPKTLLNPH